MSNLTNDITMLLYADKLGGRKTDVYGNGKMQALVYAYADYLGPDSSITQEKLASITKQDADVYIYKDDGSKVLLSTEWEKSFVSNEYNHDISRGSSIQDDIAADIQTTPEGLNHVTAYVPFYFKVPAGETGVFKWGIKYNGVFTALDKVVTVTSHNFSVSGSNFIIKDVATTTNTTLRAMTYSRDFPATHKLVKCLEYQGFRFDTNKDGSVKANSWMFLIYKEEDSDGQKWTYIGAFLQHKEASTHIVMGQQDYCYPTTDYTYTKAIVQQIPFKPICDDFSDATWKEPETYTSQQVQSAWMSGIAMIYLNKHFDVFSCAKYGMNSSIAEYGNLEMTQNKIEDSFGNMMKIDFDAQKEKWTVKNPVTVYFPN